MTNNPSRIQEVIFNEEEPATTELLDFLLWMVSHAQPGESVFRVRFDVKIIYVRAETIADVVAHLSALHITPNDVRLAYACR